MDLTTEEINKKESIEGEKPKGRRLQNLAKLEMASPHHEDLRIETNPVVQRFHSSPLVGEVRLDIGHIARALNLPVYEVAGHLRSPYSSTSASEIRSAASPVYQHSTRRADQNSNGQGAAAESIASPFVLPLSERYANERRTSQGPTNNEAVITNALLPRRKSSLLPPTSPSLGSSSDKCEASSPAASQSQLPPSQRTTGMAKASIIDTLLGPIQQKHFKVRTITSPDNWDQRRQFEEGEDKKTRLTSSVYDSPYASKRPGGDSLLANGGVKAFSPVQKAVALPLGWGEDKEDKLMLSSNHSEKYDRVRSPRSAFPHDINPQKRPNDYKVVDTQSVPSGKAIILGDTHITSADQPPHSTASFQRVAAAEYDVTNPESIYYNPYAAADTVPYIASQSAATSTNRFSDLSSAGSVGLGTGGVAQRGTSSSMYLPSTEADATQKAPASARGTAAVVREASQSEVRQLHNDLRKNTYGSMRGLREGSKKAGGEGFGSSASVRTDSQRAKLPTSPRGDKENCYPYGPVETFLSLEQNSDGTIVADLKRVGPDLQGSSVVRGGDEAIETHSNVSPQHLHASSNVSQNAASCKVQISPVDDTQPPPQSQLKGILSKVKKRVNIRVNERDDNVVAGPIGNQLQDDENKEEGADTENLLSHERSNRSVHFNEDSLIQSLRVVQTSRSTVVMQVEYRRPKLAYAGAIVAVALQGLGWTMVAAASYSSHHPTNTADRSRSISLNLFFEFLGATVVSFVLAIAQGSPTKLESLSLRHPHHLKKLAICVVSGALGLVSIGVALMFSIASVNILIFAVLPLIVSLGVATVIDKKLSVFDGFGLVMALGGVAALLYGEIERPTEEAERHAMISGDFLGEKVRYIAAALAVVAAIFQVIRFYYQAQCRRYFSPLVMLTPTAFLAALGMLAFCIADGSFTRTLSRDKGPIGEISNSTAKLMLASSICLFSSIWITQMTSKYFDNVTITGLLSLSGVLAMLLYAAYDLPVIGSSYRVATALLVATGSLVLIVAGYLNRRFVELVIDLPFLGNGAEEKEDDTPQNNKSRSRSNNTLTAQSMNNPNAYFAGYNSALGGVTEGSPASLDDDNHNSSDGALPNESPLQQTSPIETGPRPAYTPAHFDAFLIRLKEQKEKQRLEREAALALARNKKNEEEVAKGGGAERLVPAGEADNDGGIQ